MSQRIRNLGVCPKGHVTCLRSDHEEIEENGGDPCLFCWHDPAKSDKLGSSDSK